MDAAASRLIRIGQVSIGLIGLDIALNAAASRQLSDQEAAEFLYSRIREQNYIPPGSEAVYRQALTAAYRRHCGAEPEAAAGIVIRIFGRDCVSCNGLAALVLRTLDRLGIAADLEHVRDPDEIGRAGVTITPALMINGRLRSGGPLPSPAQIEQWLREHR